MFCSHCGTKIEEGNSFCTTCGAKLDNNNFNNTNTNTNINTSNTPTTPDQTDYSKAKIMCIASVVLTYFSAGILALVSQLVPVLEKLLTSIAGLCPVAGVVLLVMVRVKYPDYKPGKIIMWIYIILLALSIILFIALAAFCYYTCSQIDTSGC